MVRRDELDQPREAEDVDLELAARLVDRHVLDGAVRAVPGVVDEYVDPPCSREIRSIPLTIDASSVTSIAKRVHAASRAPPSGRRGGRRRTS
jgi:hypothetical protein